MFLNTLEKYILKGTEGAYESKTTYLIICVFQKAVNTSNSENAVKREQMKTKGEKK